MQCTNWCLKYSIISNGLFHNFFCQYKETNYNAFSLNFIFFNCFISSFNDIKNLQLVRKICFGGFEIHLCWHSAQTNNNVPLYILISATHLKFCPFSPKHLFWGRNESKNQIFLFVKIDPVNLNYIEFIWIVKFEWKQIIKY